MTPVLRPAKAQQISSIFDLLYLLQYVTYFTGLLRQGFGRFLDFLILIFSL